MRLYGPLRAPRHATREGCRRMRESYVKWGTTCSRLRMKQRAHKARYTSPALTPREQRLLKSSCAAAGRLEQLLYVKRVCETR